MSDLKTWCTKHGITGNKYATLTGEMGFKTLRNLAALPSADYNELCVGLGLKFGNKTQFMAALGQLSKQFADDENKYDGNSNSNSNSNNNSNSKSYHGPKKAVSLLFVGETGVGKSTLLKSLEDFINGKTFEEIRPTPKSAPGGASQTQASSQSQLCNLKWAVNIIDTPGIGDTQGFEVDAQHMDNIVDLVGSLGDFNACCILLQRGVTRLSSRMKYIVNELRANMPKDVENNFIVIMTRSEMAIPGKDTMSVIKGLHLPVNNIIAINNMAYEDVDLSAYSETSTTYRSVKRKQKANFQENHQNLECLLEAASEMTPYKGSKMLDLKFKRDKLKEAVGLLNMTLSKTFTVEAKINQQLRALKQAKSDEALNQAWKQSIRQPVFTNVKENNVINTHCNTCNKACHMDCQLGYGDDLNLCSAIGSNGNCVVCHHSKGSHCHQGWKVTTTYKDVVDVNLAMKSKHTKAQNQMSKIEQCKTNFLNQKKVLEAKRDDCTRQIREKYDELKKIAIIGYNEDFENYVIECDKAVSKDESLSSEQKSMKKAVYQRALETFRSFRTAIGDLVK